MAGWTHAWEGSEALSARLSACHWITIPVYSSAQHYDVREHIELKSEVVQPPAARLYSMFHVRLVGVQSTTGLAEAKTLNPALF